MAIVYFFRKLKALNFLIKEFFSECIKNIFEAVNRKFKDFINF